MKIGIVGAGNWGSNLVKSFCQLIGSENVVVFDTNRDKLTAIKNQYPGIVSKRRRI